jgi:hypothetical protein
LGVSENDGYLSPNGHVNMAIFKPMDRWIRFKNWSSNELAKWFCQEVRLSSGSELIMDISMQQRSTKHCLKARAIAQSVIQWHDWHRDMILFLKPLGVGSRFFKHTRATSNRCLGKALRCIDQEAHFARPPEIQKTSSANCLQMWLSGNIWKL